LALIFEFLSFFPATAAWSFSRVASAGNGGGLGVVQESIQDRTSRWMFAREEQYAIQYPNADGPLCRIIPSAQNP